MDHNDRSKEERKKQQAALHDDLSARVDYFVKEYDLSMIDVLGTFALISLNLYANQRDHVRSTESDDDKS